MDRQSNNILVIDPLAERPAEINSLLRNSGINVHVFHAGNATEMEAQLRERQPFLCLLHPSAVPGIPLTRICDAVARHRALLAILCTPQDLGLLRQALEECACIGVNADDPRQLENLVRHFAGSAGSTREMARAESELAELQELHALLLRSSGEAVAYLHEGLHVAANAAYLALLGLRDEAALASLSLLELVRSDEQDVKTLVRELGQGRFPPAPVRLSVHTPDGRQLEAALDFQPAQYRGEPCVQVMLRPLDESGAIAVAAPAAAGADPLTGALPRHDFVSTLPQRLRQSPGGQQAAVFIVGPEGGDALADELEPALLDDYVRALAAGLRALLGPADLLGRYGEASFAVLAFRGGRDDLHALGESLRAAAVAAGGGDPRLPGNASLGFAVAGSGAEPDGAALLAQARTARRQASDNGAGLGHYRPPAAETSPDDQAWVERLRYGLDNGDFYSVRQPIVNLDGDGEGLFENHTWLREEDGDLPQERYLPAAERVELASTIDRQVIPGLLRSISGSGDRHIINISDGSLHDFSFPGWFQRQLQVADVEARQVVLQLAADAALRDLRAVRRLADELVPAGCGLSLSGMSGSHRQQALLDQLRLAFVKLDRGLTRNLREQPANQQSVRNLVTVAAQAGAEVLADQVDNPGDMAALWQCGVKHLGGEFMRDATGSGG